MPPSQSLAQIGVISAIDLPLHGRFFQKAPRCYVKVVVDGKRDSKTAVHKRSSTPSWNEKLTWTVSKPDDPVGIELWHKSRWPTKGYIIGSIAISWRALGEMWNTQNDGQVQLALNTFARGGKSVHPTTITLCVYVPPPEHTDVDKAKIEMENAKVAVAALDTTSDLLKSVAKGVKRLNEILGDASQVHPLLETAWKMVSSLSEAIIAQYERDDKIIGLASMMNDAYAYIPHMNALHGLTDVLQRYIEDTLRQTVECSIFLRDYCQVGFVGNTVKAILNSTADHKIKEFTKNLETLKTNCDRGFVVQGVIVTSRVLESVTEIGYKQVLGDLKAVRMDTSDRPVCLHGTRRPVLQALSWWVVAPSHTPPPQISLATDRVSMDSPAMVDPATNFSAKPQLYITFWIYGFAGSGKSTIATTIANIFRRQHRLGAFLFFNRNQPGDSAPGNVIRTLASQLAAFDPRIGRQIAEAMRLDRSVTEASLSEQFATLIVGPLHSVAHSLRADGPIVVVLDALDECGSPSSRKGLLAVLHDQLGHLPDFVRIIITSRWEQDIKQALSIPVVLKQAINSVADIKRDIDMFFRGELHAIRELWTNSTLSLQYDWPEIIASLVDRSAGLFAWAFTACKYINDAHDPLKRLSTILQRKPLAEIEATLDALYSTALKTIGRWEDEDFVEDFQRVVGTIMVAKVPLYLSTLGGLASGSNKQVNNADYAFRVIQHFRCVLSWDDGPVRFLHPSFIDFLTEPHRCGAKEPWFINVPRHSALLGMRCLDLISSVILMQEFQHQPHEPQMDPPHIRRQHLEQSDPFTHAIMYWSQYVCADDSEEDNYATGMGRRIEEFLLSAAGQWVGQSEISSFSRADIFRVLVWLEDPRIPESKLSEYIVPEIRSDRSLALAIPQDSQVLRRDTEALLAYLRQEDLSQDPERPPTVAGGDSYSNTLSTAGIYGIETSTSLGTITTGIEALPDDSNP